MNDFKNKENIYKRIINILCEYKGISNSELMKIMKDKECKYILFLLLKKYDCINLENLNRDFLISSKKKITTNVRKAEEKMLINKRIRDMYFQAENIMEKYK
ncbi:MAG: hypothetical protein K0R54_4029 [Clostridiaceae bacterium]|jgi:hypothetical protein|nr:hypothetical protein [Clostridiaceae bacterium]